MKALFARGEATNHYAILGINHNAPTERIKTAYYALAKRFHPDVFSREIMTPETRSRIEAAFALISTAYETLKKTESRAKYDLKMQALNPTRAAEPLNADASSDDEKSTHTARRNFSAQIYGAEENFKEAMRAEKEGNLVLALTRFAEAARIAPHEARYRAHYGRALATDRSKRRQGEAELLAAVALAPADANLRIMLAEFYRDIGLHRRALGEIERALESEPGHTRARQLQKEIRRAG
jgi:curved DNA-binding protein CbpA